MSLGFIEYRSGCRQWTIAEKERIAAIAAAQLVAGIVIPILLVLIGLAVGGYFYMAKFRPELHAKFMATKFMQKFVRLRGDAQIAPTARAASGAILIAENANDTGIDCTATMDDINARKGTDSRSNTPCIE